VSPQPIQRINPLTGKPNRPAAPPPEALEIYPSELPKIKATLAHLQSFWNQKRVSDPADAAAEFNQMAVNQFGEIGFTVEVEWSEARDAEGNVNNPFAAGVPLYVPQVAISGRTRKEEEVDHDRLKHDIVHGLADGKKGWIDPNTGALKDEPKKKLII
jgi:hypothetical protein